MRKKYFILILTMILFSLSCKNQNKEKDSNFNYEIIADRFTFNFNANKEKFKFKQLNSFLIDSIDWGKRKNFYHKLTKDEFFSINQDSLINFIGDYEQSIDLDFFYSIQNRNSNFNEITILWQREGDYCEGITYYIFDKKGKLIDQFLVAGFCGDGGYYDKKYGKFLNDSVYKMTYEDYNERDEIEIRIKKVFERFYTISKKGKVKMSEKLILTDTLR